MNKKGYELVNFCEFDKYAVKSYCAIHNVDESLNLGDITKVDIESLPQVDFITHGSPCQDFSIAGLQKGGDEGTDTRSSLMWNSVEIIDHCKPKFVIWGNVKNVLSKKHRHNFDKYLEKMKSLGYTSYYKVLNAKNYNIPQNRERIFCISIRNDINKGFEFPVEKEMPNVFSFFKSSPEVEDRYFIKEEKLEKLFINDNLETFKNYEFKNSNELEIADFRYDEGVRVRRENLCPCLTCKVGGSSLSATPYIIDHKNKTVRNIDLEECFRVMGFSKEDYENALASGSTIPRLYKQTGNSIVVNVVYEIYKQLQKYYPNEFKDLRMISLFSGIGAFEKALGRLYEDINKEEQPNGNNTKIYSI